MTILKMEKVWKRNDSAEWLGQGHQITNGGSPPAANHGASGETRSALPAALPVLQLALPGNARLITACQWATDL
ncbi:hypothetical protein Y1Q_0023166 [Alligator mississippiensis]|uniref:Uncharacterized protein n=1 Tax=Alligator mississippiensis TaxID=8496 RepID=A0A151MZ69_ALLMI|nr:hypothetical protein Y1Q_0023166 [Alligator mississippiensis]